MLPLQTVIYLVMLYDFDIKLILNLISGYFFSLASNEKEHGEIDSGREIYEYQHQHQQQIHMATHPHLRHIGHNPSSIICIQSSHPNQTSNNSVSQNPAVQISHSHHSQSHQSHQQQTLPQLHPPNSQPVQPPNINNNDHQMLDIQQLKKEQQPPQIQNHLVQNSSHYTHSSHHQNGGESRPSVIESNQPMIIECT